MAFDNPWANAALGGAVGGGILNSMKSPDYNNPANAAMPYLDKIPGAVSPYYKQYQDRGGRAGENLESEYGQLTGNPGDLYSKLGEGYKQSPGYQFKLQQALMAGNNAAAAGGLAGSGQHQQINEQTANDIASGDFNDYMKNIMGLYNTGIKGQEGLNEQGYNANNEFANI